VEHLSSSWLSLTGDLLSHSLIGSKKKLQQIDCNTLLAEVLVNNNKIIRDSSAEIHADDLPFINSYALEMMQLFQYCYL
jgi:light-regulated signal transduction histidine kinase (bacteriophytochrome)